MAAGGVAEAFAAVRGLEATIPVEIEVDSLDGLARGDRGRRRRRPARQLRAVRDARGGGDPRTRSRRGVTLEASGGLTLEVARTVGETGVDYIAVGELTHSARVLDIGLDLEDVL